MAPLWFFTNKSSSRFKISHVRSLSAYVESAIFHISRLSSKVLLEEITCAENSFLLQ